jgi:hypothetical protein
VGFYAGTNVHVGPFTFHVGKAFDFSKQQLAYIPPKPGVDYSVGTLAQAEAVRSFLRTADVIDQTYLSGNGLVSFDEKVRIAEIAATHALQLINQRSMLAVGVAAIQAAYLDMLDTWKNRANEIGGEYLPQAIEATRGAKGALHRYINGGLLPQDNHVLWTLYYVFNPDELQRALDEDKARRKRAGRKTMIFLLVILGLFASLIAAVFIREAIWPTPNKYLNNIGTPSPSVSPSPTRRRAH